MAINRGASLRVIGLSDLNKELRELADPKQFEDELKDAHWKIAEFVAARAKPRIPVKTGAARNSVGAQRSQFGARISMGGAGAEHAMGVEFGAKQNLRRIVKERPIRINTSRSGKINIGLGARGRATILRDGEDLDTVIGRVESQSVDNQGRTTSRRFGDRVKVARYKNGSAKVRLGWNQFRPWRGVGPDAGYAIYPTIRQNQVQIREMYEDMVDKITREAFPD